MLKTKMSGQHMAVTAMIIVIAFIAFMYWRYKRATPSPTQAANDTLSATQGMTGTPISPAFQYGQSQPFQMTLDNYNVPVPNFNYSGNTQIYMPLFGFVGYGASPLQ